MSRANNSNNNNNQRRRTARIEGGSGQLGDALLRAGESKKFPAGRDDLGKRIRESRGRMDRRDEAFHSLRDLLGDGYDHINLHHHASTNLGKRLTVDAAERFTMGSYGEFSSIYNMYIWMTTQGHPAVLRNMPGGRLREFVKNRTRDMEFHHENARFICYHALVQKLSRDSELAAALVESKQVPLVSYITREDGFRIPLSRSTWWCKAVAQARDALQKGQITTVLNDDHQEILKDAMFPLDTTPVLGHVAARAARNDKTTTRTVLHDIVMNDILAAFDSKPEAMASRLRDIGIRNVNTVDEENGVTVTITHAPHVDAVYFLDQIQKHAENRLSMDQKPSEPNSTPIVDFVLTVRDQIVTEQEVFDGLESFRCGGTRPNPITHVTAEIDGNDTIVELFGPQGTDFNVIADDLFDFFYSLDAKKNGLDLFTLNVPSCVSVADVLNSVGEEGDSLTVIGQKVQENGLMKLRMIMREDNNQLQAQVKPSFDRRSFIESVSKMSAKKLVAQKAASPAPAPSTNETSWMTFEIIGNEITLEQVGQLLGFAGLEDGREIKGAMRKWNVENVRLRSNGYGGTIVTLEHQPGADISAAVKMIEALDSAEVWTNMPEDAKAEVSVNVEKVDENSEWEEKVTAASAAEPQVTMEETGETATVIMENDTAIISAATGPDEHVHHVCLDKKKSIEEIIEAISSDVLLDEGVVDITPLASEESEPSYSVLVTVTKGKEAVLAHFNDYLYVQAV